LSCEANPICAPVIDMKMLACASELIKLPVSGQLNHDEGKLIKATKFITID